MMNELVTAALLGTRNQAATSLPPLPEEISALLEVREHDAATQLLSAAAALSLYCRAGIMPIASAPLPQLAPADDLAPCSRRAGEILAMLLNDGSRELLQEWLDLAARSNQRPPYRLLPQLLDAAAAHRRLRESALRVVDRRGAWLADFNPAWQFSREVPGEELWHTGSKEQRSLYLEQLRADDPARARELVSSTWSSDPADERERWLTILRDGLSQDDEDFLETCLADRSSKVREAAGELLSGLPESRFVGRMITRLEPLIRFTAGSRGQLLRLKRAVAPQLEIELPAEFDESLERDGLKEKPPERLGRRQWWFLQIVACVPLAWWTRHTAADADELIAALPEEHRELMLRGWTSAYSCRAEPSWTVPLASAGTTAEALLIGGFLRAVPSSQRPEVIEHLLKASNRGRSFAQLGKFLECWPQMDEATSIAIFARFGVGELLAYNFGRFAHPRSLQAFEARLLSATELQGARLDQAIFEIALRRDMHREFSP